MTARLYFDTGGSRSFISALAAKRIGARYVGRESVTLGRFRDSKPASVTYKIFEFEICLPNGKHKSVRMSSEAAISCPIQLIPLDPNCPIMAHVNLAEPLVREPTMVTIDVLIGNDYYYMFIGQEQIRCPNGVVLLSSPFPFGFIAGGSLSSANGPRDLESSFLIHAVKEPNYSIERFWRIEDMGIKDNCYEIDDEVALKLFNESVKFEDERYSVKWPWKEEHPELPDNYGLALGRLKSLIKRLQPDDKVLLEYNKNILKQEEMGIIEVAPKEPAGLVHCIPHHCVMTPSKKTTKLRVVYDASAKVSKEVQSLNECLYRGPIFLANSVGIMLRWRLPTVAMVSDIEKAFHQVGLQPSERDVTRFLWLKDINGPAKPTNLVIYRFCRVPFGVISSPFLLAATAAYHLKITGSPIALNIERNMYVDNIFGAASSDDMALSYYREAKTVFAKASMNLREWFSNSTSFMHSIDVSDRGEGQTTSVLGLKWNLEKDKFTISVGSLPSPSISWTKRRVLQSIASVFDPCGFLSPVTVRGKMLMQNLWKANRGWDDQLPPELEKIWLSYLADLTEIPNLEIPRRLTTAVNNIDSHLELHCFCDASAKAYSAVVYLRVMHGSSTTIDLIFSKNRVAPVKPLTIPRLELIAVLLGIRCLKFVQQQLAFPIASKHIWSDSSCVLHLIRKDPVSTLFVQNRLKEIRTLPDVKFYFVPSSQNPADMPSRGVKLHELKKSQIWWNGPDWLAEDVSSWPPPYNSFPRNDSRPDDVSNVPCLVSSHNEATEWIMDLGRFSCLQKILRVTAYVLRFIRATRNQERDVTVTLSAKEIQHANQLWDKHIQAMHLSSLFPNSTDRTSMHIRRQLGIFQDSEGVLRCKGRYLSDKSTSELSYPKLLPKGNPYTDLIIRDRHVKLLHAGVKHTLAEIRQEYWILHGRNQVKRVLKNCMLCRYYHGGSFRTPLPPSLPEFRLEAQRPFQTVGIDYLGPLLIRDHGSEALVKVWICLFTCAAIRAIHLEVVSNLTTEQFLLCFRRFVSTYGCPDLMISDNAKQFHTAEKVLSRLWQKVINDERVQSFSSKYGITWKFITELAPWMGGFYERLIGLVKIALKKAIHLKCLTLVELQTLSCEIASILNSRPLLYSEATVEDDYLTPNHFLLRFPNNIILPKFEEEYKPRPLSADQLILSWKRTQSIVDNFWKMWQTSYLQSLQGFAWKPNNRNSSEIQPAVGTVVIVKDKSMVSTWKLGIITDLIRSHDRVCRSAELRLASGNLIRRPLKLLHPLECSKDPAGITKVIVKSKLQI